MACGLLCTQSLLAATQAVGAEEWDLVQAYQAATHVFYGEVVKIIPEPKFETGVMGVRLRDIDDDLELPLEALFWEQAKELTFSVEAQFKAATPASFAAFLPDPDLRLWTHVMSATGDIFLAEPTPPEASLLKLEPGDRALFFVRNYVGSNISVLYKARFGMRAEKDLALLQAYQASGQDSLESIVHQAKADQQALAEREAAAFLVFEDEYYKILSIQELEIRRSLLNDLVERMGYIGLWNYFDFKERYLKQHGADITGSMIPRGPTEGHEKLWHDISGELNKIEVILQARSKRQ
jgi:hypothetical protein